MTADAVEWKRERDSLLQSKQAVAYFCPRGIGPGGWTKLSPNKQTQLRRRLLLLGESLESGQVWDIRQAVSALRSLPDFTKKPLMLQSKSIMAANALYASLFIPDLKNLELIAPPPSHRNGATYLNVLRHLDMPQALAMAAERVPITVTSAAPDAWQYARCAVEVLRWEGRLNFK